MSTFQIVPAHVKAKDPGTEMHPDKRSAIECMFYNHDPKTGETSALPITPLDGDDDYKHYNDTIPLISNFMGTDQDYKGKLKGKTVLVLGGRRQGRAGTGVELVLALEDVVPFCELAMQVALAAKAA